MDYTHNNYLPGKSTISFEMHVLQAKLEIRDFFLNTCVHEIYQNIGQVLSMVRMQVATLTPATNGLEQEVETFGNVLGQSIQDLRDMSRCFFADDAILKEDGILRELKQVLGILGYNCPVTTKGFAAENEFSPGEKVITFNLLLKVILSLRDCDEQLQQITISGNQASVSYSFIFQGTLQKLKSCNQLSLEKLLSAIGATCKLSRTPNQTSRILINIPYKSSLYEQGKNSFSR